MDFRVEPALIERARTNAEGLEELVQAIWPEVFRVAAGILRDRSAAEDAAQEACASIARSLRGLKETGAFYAWMYRIAGRCAVDAARTRARLMHKTTIDVPAPEDRDAQIDLRDAIARLPLSQRAAIVLQYFAGLSSAQVASILGVPSPTVRFHSMLARRALREMLRTDLTEAQERCADA